MATGNRIVFSGVDEWKNELRNLPAALTKEASGDVTAAANTAAESIRAAYHRVTGNLAAGLFVRVEPIGEFAVALVVVSSAPHAWLYDNGSQARHYVSGGKAHNTGAMWGGTTPPTHVFVRTVIDVRRRLSDQLRAIVTRAGFVVTGSDDA